MNRLEFKERVLSAIADLDRLFVKPDVAEVAPDPPPGTTVEEAWTLYRETWIELRTARDQVSRKPKPKVGDCVRILLTNPDYDIFSTHLIADIVRQVFLKQEIPCNCSAKSVGWYMSQMGRVWGALPRRDLRIPVTDDEGW